MERGTHIYRKLVERMSIIKKSVSFDEFVYDTYLLNYGDNFSSYVQKLIILGHEALVNGAVEEKKKITSLIAQNEEMKREIKKLRFDLNKAKQGISNFDDIVDRYALSDRDLEMLREAKEIIDKNPTFLEGRFNLFKNETGKNLRFNEFKTLIHNISQEKLTNKT